MYMNSIFGRVKSYYKAVLSSVISYDRSIIQLRGYRLIDSLCTFECTFMYKKTEKYLRVYVIEYVILFRKLAALFLFPSHH